MLVGLPLSSAGSCEGRTRMRSKTRASARDERASGLCSLSSGALTSKYGLAKGGELGPFHIPHSIQQHSARLGPSLGLVLAWTVDGSWFTCAQKLGCVVVRAVGIETMVGTHSSRVMWRSCASSAATVTQQQCTRAASPSAMPVGQDGRSSDLRWCTPCSICSKEPHGNRGECTAHTIAQWMLTSV